MLLYLYDLYLVVVVVVVVRAHTHIYTAVYGGSWARGLGVSLAMMTRFFYIWINQVSEGFTKTRIAYV